LSFVHLPSGAMLLFCCAWMILGYLMLRRRVVPAEQPSRVG
jgi:hypothetical protein